MVGESFTTECWRRFGPKRLTVVNQSRGSTIVPLSLCDTHVLYNQSYLLNRIQKDCKHVVWICELDLAPPQDSL